MKAIVVSTHQRLGVLLCIVVWSLLFGPGVPPADAQWEATSLAEYSACVGPATESAGFNDVEGYPEATRAAIDCLAHYGITVGTSAGEFVPGGEVTRWQMALFLVRAAGPAGIVLPQPADQGFGDIGALPPYIQDAINQLARIGIAKGTTESSFSPQRAVTRRQMAQFLARFLESAPVGPGGVDTRELQHGVEGEHFEDVEHLSRDVHRMIAVLFDMGVVTGTSSNLFSSGALFSPDNSVTRSQMALFMSRALAHTNARPAGFVLQTGSTTVPVEESAEVVVTVRDSTHRPVADHTIDLFHSVSTEAAFNSQGRCTHHVISELGHRTCVIDPGDGATDEAGNFFYDHFVDRNLVLWAWSGAQGDRFDVEETEFVSTVFSVVETAAGFLLTDDMTPHAAKVRYGEPVTLTLQLVDRYGFPVEEEKVRIRVRIEESGEGRSAQGRPRTFTTDGSGTVQFDHVIEEVVSHTDVPDAHLSLEVLDSSDLEMIDMSTVGLLGGVEGGAPSPIAWSEEEKRANALVLIQSVAYDVVSESGSGRRNGVTALLVDQYGDPVSGERVHFKSDDENGLWQDLVDADLAKAEFRVVTDSRGRAGVIYNRGSSEPGIETMEAFVQGKDIEAEPMEHYWLLEAPDDGDDHTYEVILHDRRRRTLILEYGPDEYVLAKYDRNDSYRYHGQEEDYQSFIRHLQEGDTVEITIESNHPNEVNTFDRF